MGDLLQIGFPVLASFPYSWQGAKSSKSPRAEASRDSAMRGVPLHLYYMHFSQCARPMGSGRPQWAAGEYDVILQELKTHILEHKSLGYLDFSICYQLKTNICHFF